MLVFGHWRYTIFRKKRSRIWSQAGQYSKTNQQTTPLNGSKNNNKVLEWPSQSLDFYLFDKLWCELTLAIYTRKSSNMAELKQSAKKKMVHPQRWKTPHKHQELDFRCLCQTQHNVYQRHRVQLLFLNKKSERFGCFCSFNNWLIVVSVLK